MSLKGADRPRGADVGVNTAVSVSTAVTLLAAANAHRVAVTVQPTNGDVFVGYSSGVTAATGVKVVSGSVLYEPDFFGALYAIASAATVDVRVAEVG